MGGDLTNSADAHVLSSPARVVEWLDETLNALGVERAWRPIAWQSTIGTAGFPVPCDIDRLAASGIRVLAVVTREETLHDGATMAGRFRPQLRHAEVELVDDADHLVPIDQQELVEGLLRKFLDAP